MGKNMFTAPGTGGVQANANQAEQTAKSQQQMAGQLWGQQQQMMSDWQSAYKNNPYLSQLSAIAGGTQPSWMQVGNGAALPGAVDYSKYMGALGQTPDWKAAGQQVAQSFNPYINYSVGDQMGQMSNQLALGNLKRGISGHGMNDAGDQAAIQASRDRILATLQPQAIQAQLAAEGAIRGEGAQNAMNMANLDTQAYGQKFQLGQYQDQRDQALRNEQAQNYWNSMNAYNQMQNMPMQWYNPQSAISAMGQAGQGFGQAGQTYGQMAQGSMAGLSAITGLAGKLMPGITQMPAQQAQQAYSYSPGSYNPYGTIPVPQGISLYPGPNPYGFDKTTAGGQG